MTAKHRRGKGNHKNEDNFFKNEVAESEVRGGSNNYALHLVLFLLVVVGGATGAWFCFQQHQTLTYLTDNIMGMQMKIVKLQSSHEEMRQSSSEQHVSESLEIRLNALEDSYSLAQKQSGMALATAEQLKTSDLPAQVLSLHTEMKARLAEMQQTTVSLDQLSQLQGMLKGKSQEFEGVRIQVEGLALLSAELSQRVEGLTGSVGEAESKLEERGGQVATLSATLDGQAAEVLRLKEQLETYQAQLEASTLEMANVRGLLESEQSQRLQQASVEEQLNTVHHTLQAQLDNIQKRPVGQTEEETAPPAAEGEAATEEEALPADVEQEAFDTEETAPPAAEEEAAATEETLPADVEQEASDPEETAPPAAEEEAAATEEVTLPADVEQEAVPEAEADEGGEAAAQDEAPVEQEDSVTDETAPAEEAEAVTEDQTEEDELVAVSEKTAEGVQSEEENQEADEEETHKAEEENEVSEGEKGLGEEEVSERQEEPQDVAAEEEAEEMDEGEEPLENDALPEDEL